MTIYDILILTDGTQEVEIWLKEKYDQYRKCEQNYVCYIMEDEDFTNKLKKAIVTSISTSYRVPEVIIITGTI